MTESVFGDIAARQLRSYDADENPIEHAQFEAAIKVLEDTERLLPKDRPRADALLLARESNEHNKVLMGGMISSTAGTFSKFAGAGIVGRCGIRLLTEPENCGVTYRVIREGKARAVLAQFGGTYWLLSMATAAKSNSKGENDFTLLLCKLVIELRPRQLCAVTFSRFVRSFQHGASLLNKIIPHVDVVIAGSTQLHMQGEQQTVGFMMWNLLATISTAEREAILQRLTAGKVNLFERKQWVLGSHAQPPGFNYDPKTGKLVRIDDMQPLVRHLVELLADPQVPNWRVVKEIAGLVYDGPALVTPKMLRTGKGLSDLRASSLVRSWKYWLPLLRDGQYTYRVRNPFPGAKQFSTMKVLGAHDEYRGHLDFTYDFGTPPGGWAPDDLLIAAMGRGTRRQPGTGAAHRRSPFVGTRWTSDGVSFSITANRGRQYEIRASTGTAATP